MSFRFSGRIASVAFATLLLSIPASAADFTLKVSHSVTEESPLHRTLEQFASTVAERSGGRIEVRLFSNGQLASVTESLEGAQTGSIEIAATTAGVLAGFVPDWALMDIPFQFESATHARTFLDKTGNDILFPAMEAYNLVGLATWEQGFRNIGSKDRPVNSVEDLQGLELRTMQAPLQILAWQAMGANPTPMNWGEVYTAMQQGVLEAVENPSYVFTQSKIHETINNFTISRHIYDPIVIVGSKVIFDQMPEDLRSLVKTTLIELTDTERGYVDADVKTAEEQMAKGNIEVIAMDESVREELAKLAQPKVIEQLKSDLGEGKVSSWIEAVQASAQ